MNEKESFEEFIAKLPKGRLLNRNRVRKSCSSLSKYAEDSVLNKTSYTSRALDSQNNCFEQLADDCEERLKITGTINSPLRKSVKKVNSSLLKEFHEVRRSKINSTRNVGSRRSLAVPSLSQPFPSQTKQPSSSFKYSSRKSHGSSHTKSKVPELIQKSKNVKLPTTNEKEKILNSKSSRQPLISRRSLSYAVTSNFEKHKSSSNKNACNRSLTRNWPHISGFSGVDCKRSLIFNNDLDEKDENTKPLPIVDFEEIQAVESVLSNKNMNLKTPNKRRSQPSKINRSTFFIKPDEANKENLYREKNQKDFSKTYSKVELEKLIDKKENNVKQVNICVNGEELRSGPFICSEEEKDLNHKKLDHQRRSITKIPICTSKSRKRSSFLSKEFDQNQTFDELFETKEAVLKERSEKNKYKNNCPTDSVLDLTVSKAVLPNEYGAGHEENALRSTVTGSQLPTCTMRKDASTNTEYRFEMENQLSRLEFMNKFETELGKQQKLLRAYENLIQEFLEKREIIFSELGSTENQIKKMKKELEEHFKINKEVFMEKEETESLEYRSELKKIHQQSYNFLGTPMVKMDKSKSRSRSFSHPQSLNHTTHSKSDRENSFHSVDSIMSPFTECVGDVHRPSMAPMTPASKNEFGKLKVCYNNQLKFLLD